MPQLHAHQVTVNTLYETAFVSIMPEHFPKHVVDSVACKTPRVVDMDGDGDADVVGGLYSLEDVVWWENLDGHGTNWAAHIIDDEVSGVYAVEAADFDRDTDMDVAVALLFPGDIVLFQNACGTGTTWVSHFVYTNGYYFRRLHAVDMNGDERMDLVGTPGSDWIAWWENLDDSGTNWAERVIENSFDGAYSIEAADLDGDGDPDIVGAADYADEIAWWENADGSGTNWVKRVMDKDLWNYPVVHATDIDGDGDLDVVGVTILMREITLWENTDGTATNWSKRLLDCGSNRFTAIQSADLDRDGTMDLLTASSSTDTITWRRNVSGNGANWENRVVAAAFSDPRSIVPADIDGDGDTDVLSVADGADEIAWWENQFEFLADFPSPCWTNVLGTSTDTVAYVTNRVTWGNSSTQLAVTGWTRTGSDPETGAGGNTGRFSLTNDAVITFNWSTQYWLSADATLHGTVNASEGWHNAGAAVVLTAVPDQPYRYFAGWAGDVPDGQTNDNPLTVTMDQSRSITGRFVLPTYELVVSNAYAPSFAFVPVAGFEERTIAAVSGGVYSVCSADVDGDGDTDAVGADLATGITWWENTAGDASVWIGHEIEKSNMLAVAVCTADLDNDGDTDVMGAAQESIPFCWWENADGTGTNWVRHVLDVPDCEGYDICTGDLDGDGYLDVVSSGWGPGLFWWKNTDGTGTNLVRQPSFGGHHRPISTVDLDADGDLDVLGAGECGEIFWWENRDGSATSWTQHVVYDATDLPFCFNRWTAAADMDDDGDQDLVATLDHWALAQVLWWRNVDGTATLWEEVSVDSAFERPSFIAVADMDGDMDLDLVGTSLEHDTVAWWENSKGKGELWVRHVLTTNLDGAICLSLVDVDGDGDTDVIGSGTETDRITCWLNDSALAWFHPPCWTNTFDAQNDLTVALTNPAAWGNTLTQFACVGWTRIGTDPASGTSANTGPFIFTNDARITLNWQTQYWFGAESAPNGTVDNHGGWCAEGATSTVTATADPFAFFTGWTGDVAAGQTNDNPLTVLMDRGRSVVAQFQLPLYELVVSNLHSRTHAHAPPTAFTAHVIATPAYPERACGCDVDGDGDEDVLVSCEGQSYLICLRNTDGKGGQWSWHNVTTTFQGDAVLCGVDMDDDGDEDILIDDRTPMAFTWLENVTGDGSNWLERAGAQSTNATPCDVADLDGDGDPDVLGTLSFGDVVWWRNVDGTGTNWTEVPVCTAYSGACDCDAGDMDGDGDLDILVAASTAGEIAWWENVEGNGSSWSNHTVASALSVPRLVRAADLDADGDMDVVATAGGTEAVACWLNQDGTGTSWKQRLIASSFGQPSDLYVADLDRDTDMDVLGASGTSNKIVWWENVNGKGNNWHAHTISSSFDGARSVFAVDIDRDNDTDIVGAAQWGEQVTWWENDSETKAVYWPSCWTNVLDSQGNLTVVATNQAVSGNGDTQWVCVGWTRTGSAPASGTGHNTGHFDLISDTTVAFFWSTNLRFECTAGPNGHVAGDPSGWYPLGGSVTVTGMPATHFSWGGWTGDVDTSVNPLTLTNNRIWFVWAAFEANLATNQTPEWWLAQFGWTSNFDAAALADTDSDGAPAWEEYPAGTVPTNAASVFRITAFEPGPTDGYWLVRWSSVSNRFYTLCQATNLLNSFTVTASNIPATPVENVYTTSVGAAHHVFYGVDVERGE